MQIGQDAIGVMGSCCISMGTGSVFNVDDECRSLNEQHCRDMGKGRFPCAVKKMQRDSLKTKDIL